MARHEMKTRPTVQRSRLMRAIKGAGTKPEALVGECLRRHGYLTMKNVVGLPGKPDLYLPVPDIAVFVHGCYWHGCGLHYKAPKTNTDFWTHKVRTNRKRDLRNLQDLTRGGHKVLIVWEHALKNPYFPQMLRGTLQGLRQAKKGAWHELA